MSDKAVIDRATLTAEAKQYIDLKKQIAFLSDRQKELRTRLESVLKDNGEMDGRGHLTLELDDDIVVKHQRRESKSIDMDATEKLLADKGIKDDCIKMVPQLDEDKIFAAYYQGQLNDDDMTVMFPTKVTYAFLL